MRILFATNHAYLPERVGGSETSTHELCLTLRERGHEVAVLAGRARRSGLRAVVRDFGPGYEVFRAKAPPAAVRAVVDAIRPDVAIVQAGSPLRLAAPLVELGVAVVVYLRDGLFDELGGAVEELPAVRYLATSRALAQRFEQAFSIAVPSIPPLVRPERYRVETSRQTATFVCPYPQKGVGIALELARRRPDIPFHFVESWSLRPARRALLRLEALRLRNVVWRGATFDMREVYGRTRLVVAPSQWFEGWGRVVSEAQVSAIPALASNSGGLAEAVGDGGLLVPAHAHPDAWEAALSRVWDDEAFYERLAEGARRHGARADFQPDAIASRLEAILEDAVAMRSG